MGDRSGGDDAMAAGCFVFLEDLLSALLSFRFCRGARGSVACFSSIRRLSRQTRLHRASGEVVSGYSETMYAKRGGWCQVGMTGSSRGKNGGAGGVRIRRLARSGRSWATDGCRPHTSTLHAAHPVHSAPSIRFGAFCSYAVPFLFFLVVGSAEEDRTGVDVRVIASRHASCR